MRSRIKKIVKGFVYKLPSSAILMFHHITDIPEIKKSGCLLSFDKFNYVIDSIDKFDSLENVIAHPNKRKVAITFDDGLADLYYLAYPLLKERNIPFTAFIIYDFLDTPGYITREQLLDMSKDPLVTIGSHGMTHRIFTELDREGKKYELYESKRSLEKLIGSDVYVFAYSHGQYDAATLDLMDIYKYGMSVRSHIINIVTGHNKKILPRLNIEDDTFDDMMSLINEVFK